MERSPIDAILADFGASIGIPDLSFDENGFCCLFFDDVAVNLELDRAAGRLVAYANVGALPEKPDVEFQQMLLEANYFYRHTDGGTLGTDRESRLVVLAYQTPLVSLDLQRFNRLIENFVNMAERWATRIREFAPSAPASPAGETPGMRV